MPAAELKPLALARIDEAIAADANPDDSALPVYGAGIPGLGSLGLGDLDLRSLAVSLVVNQVIGKGADYLKANRDAIADAVAAKAEELSKVLMDQLTGFADGLRK